MTFNPNLYPPNGYVYTDSNGVLHRGDSWRDLFRTVTQFRERNGIPVGNVEHEVNVQHCANYPGLCHRDPVVPQPVRGGQSLNARVLNWLAFQISRVRQHGSVEKVSHEEALRRAGICLACPRQQSLSHACESCISSVASARKALLGDAGSVNKSLHPCLTLGEDCQTSVHLVLPTLKDPAQPANCWRAE